MVNIRIFLLHTFFFLFVAEADGQLFRVELKNRTDLYFIDAKKNSLLIFDDSIHYTQIDLTTGATKVLPCYQKYMIQKTVSPLPLAIIDGYHKCTEFYF